MAGERRLLYFKGCWSLADRLKLGVTPDIFNNFVHFKVDVVLVGMPHLLNHRGTQSLCSVSMQRVYAAFSCHSKRNAISPGGIAGKETCLTSFRQTKHRKEIAYDG